MLSLFVVGVLAGYLKITGTQVTKKFKRNPKLQFCIVAKEVQCVTDRIAAISPFKLILPRYRTA
ncbi:hypothetical protein CA596_05985 [Paenibacillus odorifer]|nr:hypothetical protein CA596_05985 [Paenibacillus odorifer]